MPFSDTAAYFEHKAKKAWSDERRQQLTEAAAFYRKLANITPTFPRGYKQLSLGRTAEHFDKRAEECLAMAELMRDAECKGRMLRLAETYMQLSASRTAAE